MEFSKLISISKNENSFKPKSKIRFMSLEDNTLFNVIEVEWSPEFEKRYVLGWEMNNKFYSNGGNYKTLSEVAKEIAYRMVGTNSNDEVRSEPQPKGGEDYFKDNEGLSGNSESTRFIQIVRKLDNLEVSELGRALMFAIEKRKRVLDD